jgi:hypothetical protein
MFEPENSNIWTLQLARCSFAVSCNGTEFLQTFRTMVGHDEVFQQDPTFMSSIETDFGFIILPRMSPVFFPLEREVLLSHHISELLRDANRPSICMLPTLSCPL